MDAADTVLAVARCLAVESGRAATAADAVRRASVAASDRYTPVAAAIRRVGIRQVLQAWQPLEPFLPRPGPRASRALPQRDAEPVEAQPSAPVLLAAAALESSV